MNKQFILFLFILFVNIVSNFDLKGGRDIARFFRPTKFSLNKELISTNMYDLLQAAKDALRFFRSKNKNNLNRVRPSTFQNIVSSMDTEKTLRFIIRTIEQDKVTKKFRILDPKFLNKNFKFIRWFSDVNSAKKNKISIPKGWGIPFFKKKLIRLTSYAAFLLIGSPHKNQWYRYPLYQIQDKNFAKTERFKFSKQKVLAGVLNKPEYKNKIKPLVWLTRDGLEEALMQGTAIVKLPGGKVKFFNVDKDNGMVYNKKIKNRKRQKRYWYFKEVKNISSTRYQNLNIIKRGGVACAGNICDIGLGKIMALRFKNKITKKMEIKLVVLLDSGSALENNFYQLDFFAGIFDSKKSFRKKIRELPEFVQAYFLVLDTKI